MKGLHSCEFLNKLDLTVNFVDLDDLECSVTAMEGNLHLKDLYMMGNPCQVKPLQCMQQDVVLYTTCCIRDTIGDRFVTK